jgi:hypothetical protein
VRTISIHPFVGVQGLAVLGLVLGLAGCDGSPASEEERPRAVAEGARGFAAGASPAAATDDAAALDETARRLAGLGGEGVPWTRHGELMDELWEETERRHLRAIREWRAAVLEPLVPEPALPLFYPFGGPDSLSSDLFFPEAPLHVLVGLQPPGRLPRLDGGDGALEGELARLRKGFESLVEAGYFQQTDMDKDLAAERLDGVLPVLYIFLARTGHRLLAVRHVALDESGVLAPADPGAEAAAVEIEYARLGEDFRRRIVYFSQDLSDEGLVQSPGFLPYLEGLGSWNTLMKAAVYLLQMEGFTALRDALLARTRTLLQDDSGLAFRDLAAADFELAYFGAYTTTLPVYRESFQDDLAAAFAGGASSPLPFAIGYHSRIGEGCLILAHRRERR